MSDLKAWPWCADCRERRATGFVQAADTPHLPATDGVVWLCTRCIQEPWRRIIQAIRDEQAGRSTLW